MEIGHSPQTNVDSTRSSSDETDEDMCDIHEQEETMELTAECLQINYKYLKSEIEPQEILDHLYSDGSFSDAFLEKCRETKERSRRNDLIIKEIHHIAKTKKSPVLQNFVKVLDETDQQYIVKHLMEQGRQSGPERHNFEKYADFLIKMRKSIAENVEPRRMVDDLLESKAISFHDHEDVERLQYRKDRVRFILEIADKSTNNAQNITGAIIDAFPNLLHEYHERTVQNTGDQQGTAISVRMHFRSGACTGRKERRERLRQIEKKSVEKFNSIEPTNNELLEDLVEQCRCKLEGLKFSSVVIQLLTEAGESLEKVLSKIKNGKAVDWIMSILDEADKQYLQQSGTTRLLVTVAVDKEGNFNNLQSVRGCLCLLDKCNIRDNRERLLTFLTLNDVDKVMQRMKSFGYKIPTALRGVPEKKRRSAFLDYLIHEDMPHICYCLLEELIKSTDRGFLPSLFTGDLHEDVMLSKSQVKQHEQFLTEELEVRMYLPVIRSWENGKSIRLLETLKRSPNRNARVTEFLKFLLHEEDVTWFWDEVKKKQEYIWDSVMSSERNVKQSIQDLIAVKLMNDQIVDDIDPMLLKRYMDAQSVEKTGFHDLEKLKSRRSQAQYLLNGLSTDTIGVFLNALRRSGYTHFESQIKAGSRSKEYVCPRIHHGILKDDKKYEFKGHFHIRTKSMLLDVENKDSTDMNPLSTVYPPPSPSPPPSLSSPLVFRYFNHSGSFTDRYISPLSTGSIRDSMRGIIWGSEEPSYEEDANVSDFDDEHIVLPSPGTSYEKSFRSKEYVCPRIHHGILKDDKKYEFKGHFHIRTKSMFNLLDVENKDSTDMNPLSTVYPPPSPSPPPSLSPPLVFRYFNHSGSFTDGYISPLSTGSIRDSMRGIIWGSEEPSYEEDANVSDFDDEHIVLPSPGTSYEKKTKQNQYIAKSDTYCHVLKKIQKLHRAKSDGGLPETKIAWLPNKSYDAEQKQEEEEEEAKRPLTKHVARWQGQCREFCHNIDSNRWHEIEQYHTIPEKIPYNYRRTTFDRGSNVKEELTSNRTEWAAVRDVNSVTCGSFGKCFGLMSQNCKSRSEAELSEFFNSSCSVKTVPEERSNSSPQKSF